MRGNQHDGAPDLPEASSRSIPTGEQESVLGGLAEPLPCLTVPRDSVQK